MGNYTTVTQAQFDTALGAVPISLYGPYERLGTVSNVSPNSNMLVSVRSIPSPALTLEVNYNDLIDPKFIRLRYKVAKAVAARGWYYGELAAIVRIAAAFSAQGVDPAEPNTVAFPPSPRFNKELIDVLRNMQPLSGSLPLGTFEAADAARIVSFTVNGLQKDTFEVGDSVNLEFKVSGENFVGTIDIMNPDANHLQGSIGTLGIPFSQGTLPKNQDGLYSYSTSVDYAALGMQPGDKLYPVVYLASQGKAMSAFVEVEMV